MLPTASTPNDAFQSQAAPGRAGDALRQARKDRYKAIAHKMRCRAVKPPTEEEVARMVAEFHARGGQVTLGATAHVMAIQNGAGRDADRWTL